MTGLEILNFIGKYAGFAVTTFVAGGLGAYLGSYLKKKGENLATHEDLDKLVTQMAAVTTATKNIEAQISDDVWQRQKRWEAKREAIFEVMRKLGELEATSARYSSAQEFQRQSGNAPPDAGQRLEEYLTALKLYGIAKNVATLTCGYRVTGVLSAVQLTFNRFTREGGTDRTVFFETISRELDNVYRVLTDELGMPFKSPSSGPSATPTAD
jgi:hypothetical protein